MFIVYGPLLTQTDIKHHPFSTFIIPGGRRKIRHLLFALIPLPLKDTLLTATMRFYSTILSPIVHIRHLKQSQCTS